MARMAATLNDLVDTSARVGATSRRLEKIERIATLLRRLGPEELAIAVRYLSGELPQGRIGLGPAAVRSAVPTAAAEGATLGLAEVDATFASIAGASGPGSTGERRRLLGDLLARATAEERDFLVRLVVGELRQGALEGVMADAVARATDVRADEVRRACMFRADLGEVARVARAEGAAGLSRFGIELFRPVQPMLAQTADDPAEALGHLGEAAFEYKLDGARVQVHKGGDAVRVFTRGLHDVTPAVPEIVEAVAALPARELVLDGEAQARRPDGTPWPFQVTMRRFGRKLDVAAERASLPLAPFFFDVLYIDGTDLTGRPARERFEALGGALPAPLVVPRLVTDDAGRAAAFLDEAIRRGHEGAMAKSLDAAYQAGGRGRSWLKIKPAHTLDLVVLAAEWGSGRRRGFLSNLHLGARDPRAGGFVMLGKTFKGMTDEMLRWQTGHLLGLEIARDAHTVHVRPELVVEIAFNDVQTSPQYPGGLALRFARVKRYRTDKRADDADTIDGVRAIHVAAGGSAG